jgi:hypothetical protein
MKAPQSETTSAINRFRKVGRRRGRQRLDDAGRCGGFLEVSVISVGHRKYLSVEFVQ